MKHTRIYRLNHTTEGGQLFVKSKVCTFRDILKYTRFFDDGIFNTTQKDVKSLWISKVYKYRILYISVMKFL